MSNAIQIAGAGPAGLAAAIILARAGCQVVVHEAHEEVGHRFQGDYQGLENWSSKRDVLSFLKMLGLSTEFTAKPFYEGTAYDYLGNAYKIQNTKPLFYLVERGPAPDTLDSCLYRQAVGHGVEVIFNSRLKHVSDLGILAAGPAVADAVAVGYHFETGLQDGFWVICDDEIAPKGYAYLLVMKGRGTVKTCMFVDFKHEKHYVEKTVEAFRNLVGLDMINPRFHGGSGNFRIPESAYSGPNPVIGEQAGFQDTLWGFGMRCAIHSGILAAHSLLEKKNYDVLWKRLLLPQMQTSVVNRAIYSLLGNTGYRWLLRRWSGNPDVRHVLYKAYRPTFFKKCLLPWAQMRYASRFKDKSCNHVNCHCVWCRGKSR